MAEIEMPALVGDDPLGFLAALGVLRLVTVHAGWDATLCWPAGPRRGAVLGGAPDGFGLEALAGVLFEIVEATRGARLIPGVDAFPPVKEGSSGGDPVKDLSFEERSALARASLQRDESFGDWLVAAVALAVPDDAESKHRLTAAFVRPTGQVTFDRSLSGSLKDATRPSLLEALSAWRRAEDVTGNYFDQRAIRDDYVGQHLTGAMKNAGVPGASWLALMALPFLPVRSVDGQGSTVLWLRRRRPSTMQWPVWTTPLTLRGAEALLDHPVLVRIEAMAGEQQWRARRVLRALRVAAVFRSERRPGPKSPDGALGPAEVVVASTGRAR